jgi:hypothetical protein
MIDECIYKRTDKRPESICLDVVYFAYDKLTPAQTGRYADTDVFTIVVKSNATPFSAATHYKSQAMLKKMLQQMPEVQRIAPDVNWDGYPRISIRCFHNFASHYLVEKCIDQIKQRVMALNSNVYDVFIGWNEIQIILDKPMSDRADSKNLEKLSSQILNESFKVIQENDAHNLWGDNWLRVSFGDRETLEGQFFNDKNRFINDDCDHCGGYIYGHNSIKRND